jgi:hypothetical protein
MNCRKTLRILRQVLGAGGVTRHVISRKDVSDSWQYVVGARLAGRVLRLVRPYLVTKAAEADLALAFLELPGRFGRWTPVSERGLRQRIVFYWKLRAAKTRWFAYVPKLSRRDRQEICDVGLEKILQIGPRRH